MTCSSSVTFTSIDQSYGDLVLVAEGKTVSGGRYVSLQFNSDTGTNYSTVAMYGDGTSAVSYSSSGDSYAFASETWGSTTNSLTLFQIMDYTATDKHTTILTRQNRADGATGATANRWSNTSAVTTISLQFTSGGDFASGASFSLYGIAK